MIFTGVAQDDQEKMEARVKGVNKDGKACPDMGKREDKVLWTV